MQLFFAALSLHFLTGFGLKNGSLFSEKTEASVRLFKQGPSAETTKLLAADSLKFYAEKFNQLNTKIRDRKIDQAKAKKEVALLLPLLKRYYFQGKNSEKTEKKFFPVKGYSHKALGGTNGSGYLPKGYNYYHGNRHTGHPAHDIFIYDKDQNSLDDKTGKPVKIVSVSSGVVIAAEPQWEPESLLRGGVYLWVYDPAEKLLYYYAHNQKLLVKPGDVVQPGQELATMGRTGLNAAKKRSPTHLHFMALKVTPEATLPPVDLYGTLVKL